MADSSSPKPANGGGGGGGGGGGEEAVPTNILWVGNIVADTTDADFMGLFAEYGTLDCTARHSSRSWSFAFVYFKDASEAEAAREALQGHGLLGSPIKIDFCHTVELVRMLAKNGLKTSLRNLAEYKILDSSEIAIPAVISYIRLNDAISAVRSMRKNLLDGEVARVDYLRTKLNQRYGWSEYYEHKWQIDDSEGPQTDLIQRQSDFSMREDK